MIETLLPVILLGKMKRLKMRYLFTTWSFYPILIAQCLLLALQICVFNNIYSLVYLAPVVKTSLMLVFLFPMFVFKLYKPALVGAGFVVSGTMLNQFAMAQNGGKMPVFPSFSYLTGYVKPYTFQSVRDIHILGNSFTHFKFLTDYIDVGYSILSPGDLLIHFFVFLMFYYMIKAVNRSHNSVIMKLKDD